MRLRDNFPFERLVKNTPGYVGADLQTLCKEASIIAVERAIQNYEQSDSDSDENSSGLSSFYIEVEDFEKASKLVKPSA
jgi:SpoVK/Ycf46/Vps4 family AAA+-type ATPase